MSGPPDPSLPDQSRAKIRDEITQYLSDPLSFPPELIVWLSAFVNINGLVDTPKPTGSTTATPI